ncbi:hypothetical protein CISIN_1g0356421mg, partial [Citrus sinensis]
MYSYVWWSNEQNYF